MRKYSVLSLLLLLALLTQISMAQGENVVRAIWNQDVFVVINISDGGVDLSELSFEGANGAILAENWVMAVDPNTTESYSLTNVRPGSCLIAYRSGSTPTPPTTVTCTRTIGEFEVTNLDDVIWTVDRGTFTPVLAGAEGTSCDTVNRTACDVQANPQDTNVITEDDQPEEVVIKAIWNDDIFVLINSSGFGVDLSELSLESVNTDGAITPDLWVLQVDEETTLSYDLDNVRPGSCLIAYLGETGAETEMPELPENVDCTRTIAIFTAENPEDQVWVLESGGFTPVVDGVEGEVCEYGTTTDCDITVPNAEIVDPNATEEPEATDSGAPVRVLWTDDILVVINISDEGVDLSGLSLEATNGGGVIDADNWVLEVDAETTLSYSLTDVRPGSCLVAYLGAEGAGTVQPELPEGVECTRVIGRFTAANLADLVWSVESAGFTPVVEGVENEACDIVNSSRCDVNLP
ncbi:MAG: hypothetical protein MUF87_21505 [Anaerolineae bacterium]|jgi:hypothetical protein|nr:hypothetical protein [Anaerolineae bacterium]